MKGLFLCPKGDKVLARKGSRSVYKVIAGDEKESITVLFNVCANGVMLPPFILFWYERLPAVIVNSLPSGWICGSTERGWMTGECFFKYITGQFYPWLDKNQIQFPVVQFVHGHSSHLALELSIFFKQKQIELIALYPNATHILQPLDVAVFHRLKSAWKKMVDKWRIDHAQQLKREHFAIVLKSAIDEISNLSKIIQNGFATYGLSPLLSDAVDYEILNKELTKKKKVVNNPTVQEKNTVSTHDEEEGHNKHLQEFESRLSPEIISEFNEAVENNTLIVSNSNNQGLFEYWLKCRRLCGLSVNNVNEKESSGVNDAELADENLPLNAVHLVDVEYNQHTNTSLQQVTVVAESHNDTLFNLSEGDEILDIREYNDDVITNLTGNNEDVIVLHLEDTSTTQSVFEETEASMQEIVEQEHLSSREIFVLTPEKEALTSVAANDSSNCCSEDSGINVEDVNTTLSHVDNVMQPTIANVDEAMDTRESFDKCTDVGIQDVLDLSLCKFDSFKEQTVSGSTEPRPTKKEAVVSEAPTMSHECKLADVNEDDHSVQEKLAENKNKSVETIFKEILPVQQNTVKNKSKKKKISPVLTSEEWQTHHKKIKEEKENKQRAIEERKKLREEKKRQREEEKKEKKKLDDEIKKLREKKKNIINIKKEII